MSYQVSSGWVKVEGQLCVDRSLNKNGVWVYLVEWACDEWAWGNCFGWAGVIRWKGCGLF